MIASMHGHSEVVQTLLKAPNIDVNAADRNGLTSLMLASARGHAHVVRLLLSCSKVDITKREENGQTALDLAEGEIAEAIVSRDQIFQGQGDTCQYSKSS